METRFPDRIGSNDAVDAGFPSSKNTPLSLNRPEPNTRLTLPPFYPSSRAAYEAKTGIDLEAIHSGSRVAQVLVNPWVNSQDATTCAEAQNQSSLFTRVQGP